MHDTTPKRAHRQQPTGPKRLVSLTAALIVALAGCASDPSLAALRPMCFGGTDAARPPTSPRLSGSAVAPGVSSGTVVLAATGTGAEPVPQLTPEVLDLLRTLGARDDACAVLLKGRRHNVTITTMPITPFRANGEVERGSHRSQLLERNLRAIQEELAEPAQPATGPGLDLLGLWHEAVRRYPGSTIVLVSSGVTTVDPVDVRRLGWDADPRHVSSMLRGQGWLPDAAGTRVTFIGLGDAAGSQPPLPPPLHRRIVVLWQELCRAAAADSCVVDARRTSGGAPRSRVAVPVVPLPEPDATPGEVRIPAAMLFELDSAEITAQADAVLSGLAERGRRDHLVVTGHTDASTGSAEHNQRLSLARAQAVARRLVALGVPHEHLDAVIGSGSQGYTAESELADPGLISEHRCVTVTFVLSTTPPEGPLHVPTAASPNPDSH